MELSISNSGRCSFVLLLLMLMLMGSSVADAETPGAYELLAQIREAYDTLDAYRDRGTLERRPRDVSEPASRLSFETVSSARGFRWQFDGEKGRKVFWREGRQGWSYDANLEQYRPVDALLTEMVASLGAGVLDVLVVPATLLGGEVLEDPEGAAVEGPEVCGEASCWVLTLSRMGGTIESTLWVDLDLLLIRRVEVQIWPASTASGLADEQEPGTLIVEHQLEPVTGLVESGPIFVPPTEADLVEVFDPGAQDDDDHDLLAYGFSEVITVDNASIVTRVTDRNGEVLTDLQSSDFVVKVGREEIPVVAVDWISPFARSSGFAPLSTISDQPTGLPPSRVQQRFVVLFVQADFNAVRIRGQLRLRHYVEEEFLPALHPDDYIAILTFDSHLKLWHDFTRDRESIAAALHQAIRFGGKPMARRNRRGPSLLDAFDIEAGRKMAYPEEALRMVGETLAGFPGEKDVVYLGWGMGSFDYAGVRMRAAYWPAIRALQAARATVYSLDATDAAAHDLAVGMRRVAADTGGTYQKTHSSKLATLATRRVAAMMRGHYVLTLDVTTAPEGELKIRLREKKGEVFYRPVRIAGGEE